MTIEEAIRILKEIIDEGWLISDFDKCLVITACEMAIKALEKESTYCPKFRNQQEKQRIFHTLTVIEKYFSIIGNDDDIDDILILKDLVQKMEVEE